MPGHKLRGQLRREITFIWVILKTKTLGIAWLNRTCSECRYCRSGRENLCERAHFTGWTKNGGYAEYVSAPAAFVYSLPERFDDLRAAPLLCAGIIGYRSLRLTGIEKGKWS